MTMHAHGKNVFFLKILDFILFFNKNDVAHQCHADYYSKRAIW